MLRAITNHAEEIRQGINDQNAEVLFATSTFMALYSSMVPPGDDRGPPLHVSIRLDFGSPFTELQRSGFAPTRARELSQKSPAGTAFAIPTSSCISKKIRIACSHPSSSHSRVLSSHMTSSWMAWTSMAPMLRLLLLINMS